MGSFFFVFVHIILGCVLESHASHIPAVFFFFSHADGMHIHFSPLSYLTALFPSHSFPFSRHSLPASVVVVVVVVHLPLHGRPSRRRDRDGHHLLPREHPRGRDQVAARVRLRPRLRSGVGRARDQVERAGQADPDRRRIQDAHPQGRPAIHGEERAVRVRGHAEGRGGLGDEAGGLPGEPAGLRHPRAGRDVHPGHRRDRRGRQGGGSW